VAGFSCLNQDLIQMPSLVLETACFVHFVAWLFAFLIISIMKQYIVALFASIFNKSM
jgi:hypothetical protein